MNKLLTTITLLCFSVAANADIYFCTAEADSSVHVSGDNFADGGINYDGQTFIIDTTKGFRSTNIVGYDGSCEEKGIFIRCETNSPTTENVIVVHADKLTFTYTLAIYGWFANATAGTCTKA